MPASASSPANLWDKSIAPYLDKYCLLLCLCMVAVACGRIISTYDQLSLTTDETFHFSCAIEYLGNHSFAQDLENPPVARAVQALGPYLLLGARPIERSDAWQEGLAIIALSGNYHRTVFLLRLGTLPFFLLACAVVGCWSGHAFGKPVAVIAVGLFTLLPTALADAGLHTTDMALGASVGAAFLATILWAEKPTWLRALLLGACTALAVLSKFTALGYVSLSVVLALACYWFVRRPGWQELRQLTRRRAVTFLLAAATTMLLVWAAYLFSFGAVRVVHGKIFTLPAPEFFAGLRVVREHIQRGHSAFLLGKTGRYGWWYYYPIALLVKLPIAFLIMSAIGVYVCVRERARPAYLFPLAFCVAILLPAMTGPIDIGIRHIEPIYIGLSIIAALGLVQLLRAIRSNLIAALTAAALVAWMIVSVAVQHPDYLAYFNGFAGRHPENVLVDSNYDWGQELISLSRRLHQLEVKKFSLACLDGVQNYQYMQAWYGLPQIQRVDPRAPSPGWNVVCPTVDKALRSDVLNGLTGVVPWYDQMAPTERLGPLSLYYIPPGNPTGSSPESGSPDTPSESLAPSASDSH
jgi:hypothetical protein